MKNLHEIRDPIHVFVRLDSEERRVVDSRFFQRLRHIHQLAMSFLVYPGATHRRFEHSLGVMELAGRVFDVITHPDAWNDEARRLLSVLSSNDQRSYWRRVLRMSALCHDLGHLPFSHAAEKELLPPGWTHEKITRSLIESSGMNEIWGRMTPALRTEDIVKLAIGPKEARDLTFTAWEAILSEIITGDAFGVDRMDYLLRDSHHAGVAYGRFDHYRLIDTLRILPPQPSDDKAVGTSAKQEPTLGVEEGGLHSAEALLIARYFMFSQVYFHPIRRIYDIHLKDFLKEWLDGGKFSSDVEAHLAITDNEVMGAILAASRNAKAKGHEPARRIAGHSHFRLLYQQTPEDLKKTIVPGEAIFRAATDKFGAELVRYDAYPGKGGLTDFPVRQRDGRIASGRSLSDTLKNLPVAAFEYVFVAPDIEAEAGKWLESNREKILDEFKEEEE